MNDILKQRLVGALILIALGVVFWPIIFVEQGVTPLGEAAHIPARPSVDTTQLEPPGKDGLRESPAIVANQEMERAEVPLQGGSELASSAPVVTEAKGKAADKSGNTRTEAPVKPEIDADGVPIAWILQVASVSSRDKAEELRLRLIAMGHKAYIKKIRGGDSVLLRIYVGPKFERARLASLQSTIDSEFKVNSIIRRYVP